MKYLEGFYFPNIAVQRIGKPVARDELAGIIEAEYACKGVSIRNSTVGVLERSTSLLEIDNGDLLNLMQDQNIFWFKEFWPISSLRVTRMNPPWNDPYGLNDLIKTSGKRFEKLADMLKTHNEIVDSDVGFESQPQRDCLPILGLRGILHNHIIDGHHRTILSVWGGQHRILTVTAYKH